MFFGVNITPVRHRLGINIKSRREESRSLDKRNRARTKYGIPFTSRWKVEVQNLSREISWQDLKDFCFNKTRVRPSHADVHRDKKGFGSLCCATEGEMKTVVQKLNGSHYKGKSLRVVVDQSVTKDSTKSHGESRREDRHRSDRHKNDRSKNEHHKDEHHRDEHHGDGHHRDAHHRDEHHTDGHHRDEHHSDGHHRDEHHSDGHHRDEHHSDGHHRDEHHRDEHHHHRSDHHSDDRHKDRHRDHRHRSERHRDDHASVSNHRSKDESKVIIHQPNGDRVITERISNHEMHGTGDDGHHSDNEQTYFKRDRRNSSRGGGGRENGLADVRLSKRTRAIYKYGMPYKTKWRLRVENLSSEVSWQDLKDLIRPYADVRYADAHKPIQGIGNVCVSTPEGLQNIINKLNNSDIKGMVARFIDESEQAEESAESNDADQRARSRSPHRSHRSRSTGNDCSVKSESK